MEAATARREDATLLHDSDFRLVAGAVGLSALGDWVAIVALGLYVKDAADSGLVVAAIWVCLFGPSVAFAAHAGLVVDRLGATRVLACVSALGALAAIALALSDAIAPVLALTALLGLVFAVSQPAEFALVPLLAGERDIRATNGRLETARYLGCAVGPLLGSVLFAVGGLGLAMLIDAATFAAVAGAALALRARHTGTRVEQAGVLRARDGIGFLLRDRVLSLAMLVAFGSLLFMSAVWVAELFFVQDVLGRAEIAYGLMLSVWTLGMAFGAMLVSRRVAVGYTATGALAAITIQGSALALPAAILGFPFFLACMFMGGLAHGVKNVLFRSLIHSRVPAPLHGRAFAAYNGIRNSAELTAFLAGGLLIAGIGARGTVAFAGGLAAIVGLAGLIAMLRPPLARPGERGADRATRRRSLGQRLAHTRRASDGRAASGRARRLTHRTLDPRPRHAITTDRRHRPDGPPPAWSCEPRAWRPPSERPTTRRSASLRRARPKLKTLTATSVVSQEAPEGNVNRDGCGRAEGRYSR